MSFQAKDLSVLSYANGFTFWHYLTDDTYKEVRDMGYFDLAHDMLREGDLLVCQYDQDSEDRGTEMLIVHENRNKKVYTIPMNM